MALVRKLSVWYVLATPIIAGLSTLQFQIGGFNYTGFIWALLLPLGLCLLTFNRLSGVDPGGIFPSWPWLAWCGFLFLSLCWGEDTTRRNVQDALQLCMPIVVGMLAASAIRTHDELRALFVAFGLATMLLTAFTVAYVSQLFDREWMDTHVRGTALATTLCGCVFLADFPRRKLLPIGGWGACLLMTTLTSSRMATLALLAAPILQPHLKGKLLWKGLAGAVFLCLGLIVFNTQTFQEHFFHSGSGTVGDIFAGDYKDLGRFEAWEAVWNEAWRRPLLGAGVGSSYLFVPLVWEEMYHVHNDYLRVFFELGLVGLVIFVLVCVWQLFDLRRQIASTEGIVRTTFVAAWLGFCAMLISCATDNTLVYTVIYTDPLFALLGAGYGAVWAERRAKSDAATDLSSEFSLTGLHPRLQKLDLKVTTPTSTTHLPRPVSS